MTTYIADMSAFKQFPLHKQVVLFQMLFWGLREPKRIQLLSVDRPRMEIQCGGVTLKSSQIKDFHESSNFENPVTYIDLVRLTTFTVSY